MMQKKKRSNGFNRFNKIQTVPEPKPFYIKPYPNRNRTQTGLTVYKPVKTQTVGSPIPGLLGFKFCKFERNRPSGLANHK